MRTKSRFGIAQNASKPGTRKSNVILAAIEDEQLTTAVKIIEQVVGDLSVRDTGVIFSVPIDYTKGIYKIESKIILEVAVMIFAALLFGRIGKLAKLPNVTGYLIAGLILGPSFLNIIPQTMVSGFSVISDMALGFIAFSVGCEFSLKYYRQVGLSPILIAIMEATGAIILVTVTLIVLGFDVKLSIMLGAIAAATAPAQTIMVINQYKAKAPLPQCC